jgi:IS1 family transposase
VGRLLEEDKRPVVNILPLNVRVRIASALVEGNGIRGIERMTGIHRDTINRLGLTLGEACHRFAFDFVGPVHASTIQIDEIWTFVQKKQKRVKYADEQDTGDQYVFVAMDADSKLVISYLVAKRTATAAQLVLADVRSRVLGEPQITTDGFQAYAFAVGQTFGPDAHYAQVVKHYTVSNANAAQIRYSPGRIRAMEKTVISGDPNMRAASTSHVERQNLTMRTQMKRFVRLTNGFSKKVRNLQAAIGLHFAHYNFCRVHETTRQTPAMAAGLTDHTWSMAELLTTALDHTPVPTVPTPAPPPAPTSPAPRPRLRLVPGGRAWCLRAPSTTGAPLAAAGADKAGAARLTRASAMLKRTPAL